MATLADILSITSGFVLMGYHMPSETMLGTSIVVDLALAPLTAVIAARRGRSVAVWLLTGLAFGMWALAAVLLMKSRINATAEKPGPPDFPSPSDAA